MQQIPPLAGAQDSTAAAINNAGVVVGASITYTPAPGLPNPRAQSSRAMSYANGRLGSAAHSYSHRRPQRGHREADQPDLSLASTGTAIAPLSSATVIASAIAVGNPPLERSCS